MRPSYIENIPLIAVGVFCAAILTYGIVTTFISSPIESTSITYPPSATIAVGDTKLTVDIAATVATMRKGLGERSTLSPSDGMLFIFEQEALHGIWMKDMQFAIDIVWIDKTGKIVAITEGVTPETYPTVFRPPVPAQYVIETNAYAAKEYGLMENMVLSLPEATEG